MSPRTLTVRHTPHTLLTVVASLHGALAAAPQPYLTAADINRDHHTVAAAAAFEG